MAIVHNDPLRAYLLRNSRIINYSGIAEVAGCTKGNISLFVSGRNNLSKKTRKRIVDRLKYIGYKGS